MDGARPSSAVPGRVVLQRALRYGAASRGAAINGVFGRGLLRTKAAWHQLLASMRARDCCHRLMASREALDGDRQTP